MQTTTTTNEHALDSRGSSEWVVRCGTSSQLFRVRPGTNNLDRGITVLCRTSRGLEIGEVLAECHYTSEVSSDLAQATLVRLSRPEDQLLWTQLRQLSEDASLACQSFLQSNGLDDVLIEVEPLFDGTTLFFHFLGEPGEMTEAYVEELATVYQKNVASSKFAELLEHGCGPGCGTPEKSGCGTSSGCAVCSITGACGSKKKK